MTTIYIVKFTMETTLHYMLIHNENDSLQKIIKKFQHLHSYLNFNENQILQHN